MTVVILLLECFSERPTDVLVSLHNMFYYSIFNLYIMFAALYVNTCILCQCRVIDLLNYYSDLI